MLFSEFQVSPLHFCNTLFVLCFSGLFVACSTAKSSGDIADLPAPVPVSGSAPPPSPMPASPTLEEKLLRQAMDAFKNGQYTTPEHDNAYDRFHSVLILNANNEQARSGLQAILLKYAGLIRVALKEGRVNAAGATLHQVEIYYPGNALVLDLKSELASAQAAQGATRREKPAPPTPWLDELVLPIAALSAKDETVIQLLADVALRLKSSDESVLIYARSDREGRWIYKQLNRAADGYRVRGDIRIARIPKLQILPPI